jgi:two-component system, OmpR family, KDP operon response regulator KdpE
VTRILVVDDEPQILRALRINLKTLQYDVETASTGVEALATAARRTPDAVLLDLGLPDMDGIEVILGLRGWTSVPIVVLSGRAGAQEKIAALDAGADDYVTKPFAMEELLARLRAVLRRQPSADGARADESVITVGRCRVDLASHTVVRTPDPAEDGYDPASEPELVRLTKTEWGLLEVLLKHPGQLVSSARLLSEVWGTGYDNEAGYLRFHIARLRRKLETDPQHPRHFLTEYGVGYRYVP